MAQTELAINHLHKYLTYYKDTVMPGYAVLVTGEWGVGKTHQVKKALPRDAYHYISLFGVQTAEELTFSVYAKMEPGKAGLKKFLTGFKEISAEVDGVGGGAIGGLLSNIGGYFIREDVDPSKILVFDDLERCSLPVRDTLGLINRYVEHHGCRVIVIAHDKKIAKQLRKSKEKVFGHTLKVSPDIGGAYAKFAIELQSVIGAQALEDHKAEIIETFSESEVASLRILRHVMEDTARLYAELDDVHRNNKAAMDVLLRLFVALDTEVRSHRLLEQDLDERRDDLERATIREINKTIDGKRIADCIDKFNERFKGIDFDNQIISAELSIEMLLHGVYDQANIRSCIDKSVHFVQPKEQPPWRVFLDFDQVSAEISDQAQAKMLQHIQNREAMRIGDMQHTFALLLMMSNKRLIKWSTKRVVKECQAYISDLLQAGELPSRELSFKRDEFPTGFDNYGFWVEPEWKDEFYGLIIYLSKARTTALERKFPTLHEQIFEAMKADGNQFYEMVCYRQGQEEVRYSHVPILAGIKPAVFVKAWLASPAQNWSSISNALVGRYQSGGLYMNNSLTSELRWIHEVFDLYEAKFKKAKGMVKLRMQRAYPHELNNILERAKVANEAMAQATPSVISTKSAESPESEQPE